MPVFLEGNVSRFGTGRVVLYHLNSSIRRVLDLVDQWGPHLGLFADSTGARIRLNNESLRLVWQKHPALILFGGRAGRITSVRTFKYERVSA
jgi:hypothetical protein